MEFPMEALDSGLQPGSAAQLAGETLVSSGWHVPEQRIHCGWAAGVPYVPGDALQKHPWEEMEGIEKQQTCYEESQILLLSKAKSWQGPASATRSSGRCQLQ